MLGNITRIHVVYEICGVADVVKGQDSTLGITCIDGVPKKRRGCPDPLLVFGLPTTLTRPEDPKRVINIVPIKETRDHCFLRLKT